MINTYKKHVNKTQKDVKNVRKREKQLGLQRQNYSKQIKEPPKTKKQFNRLKNVQSTRVKAKQKLKSDLTKVRKNANTLKKLGAFLSGLGLAVSVANAQAQKFLPLLATSLKNVNTFTFPNPRPVQPTRPKPGKPSTTPRPVPKKKKVSKQIKTSVKKTTRKIVRRPPPKKRKKLRVRLKLNFDTKLPKGQRLAFGVKFRERKNPNKPRSKQNPVVTKSRNLKLPLNRAIARAFGGVDTSTQRSAELFISGTTTKKDISKPAVTGKFRIRKTKTALKFVEKTKNLIDTKGEKRGLALSRALAPKKRKTKKKVSKVKKTRKK